MPDISMKNMLSAGVHFGHQTHRWNPKMRQFIFGPRNGIHIIDLEQTVSHTQQALQFAKRVVAEGGKILFVATKNQAKETTKQAAIRASMLFVTERWLGGTLTNFSTIRRGVEKLIEIETWKVDGTYELLPKKETVRLERKRKKLESNLGGIREMKSLPGALFVIDPETERNAVREANRLGIPVIALVDTNCNPDPIDFVIPGNDDAIKSVELFVNLVADACLEGAAVFEQKMRQSTPTPKQQTTDKQKEQTGPIVEKVNKRLKIPTEIDYRIEDDEPSINTMPTEEAEGSESNSGGSTEGKAETEASATPETKKKE